MKIRNTIGRSFVKLGLKIMSPAEELLARHELLPDSPFEQAAQIVCSDTEEELRARAMVRNRVGDDQLARAYAAYTTDYPKGSITEFNQLPSEERRKYFESDNPDVLAKKYYAVLDAEGDND